MIASVLNVKGSTALWRKGEGKGGASLVKAVRRGDVGIKNSISFDATHESEAYLTRLGLIKGQVTSEQAHAKMISDHYEIPN